MKVRYKCTFDQVNAIIDIARDEEREIDYIELSSGEWFSFQRKVSEPVLDYFAPPWFLYRGVRITRRDT